MNPKQEARRVRQYTRRNEILARMGYPTYAAYLASPLWAKVRRAFLNDVRKDFLGGDCPCWSCGAHATQVQSVPYNRSRDRLSVEGIPVEWVPGYTGPPTAVRPEEEKP